ncbi:DUF1918 domain-containing protein [Yinghuangia seranimata]|uniref:DUF1918 domain-containing protein n=1 Tax=Yinghuangia seranimata TaxID=408067 RepID=UPI00248D0142|nr:DUF1918 domain-containing protein [Yinghuangia seranimata]MDI2129220.1 DUF1918 domain-containing protein [Yinghuangia seranimata]
MHATIGDQLHVHGNAVGQADRIGEILEVRGPDGAPPYVVRFDDGHTGLIFPGPDAEVEHAAAAVPGAGPGARSGRSAAPTDASRHRGW